MEKLSEDFYKNLLNNISDGIYFVDKDRKILSWNKTAERITGFEANEVVGKHCNNNILRHIDEKGNELCISDCPLTFAINNQGIYKQEVFLHRKDGSRVPVHVSASPVKNENGEIIGAVEIFRENFEMIAMQEKVKALQEQAYVDGLTGIPNRRFLLIELDKRIAEFKRYRNTFGVLFVDIDDFKKVNDIYGHEMGDKVLIMVSGTLLSNMRVSDIVGRWGGEEFLVVTINVNGKELGKIAERLRVLAKNSAITTETANIRTTVSIGGTVVKDTDSIAELIARADKLMLKAKKEGKDRVEIA